MPLKNIALESITFFLTEGGNGTCNGLSKPEVSFSKATERGTFTLKLSNPHAVSVSHHRAVFNCAKDGLYTGSTWYPEAGESYPNRFDLEVASDSPLFGGFCLTRYEFSYVWDRSMRSYARSQLNFKVGDSRDNAVDLSPAKEFKGEPPLLRAGKKVTWAFADDSAGYDDAETFFKEKRVVAKLYLIEIVPLLKGARCADAMQPRTGGKGKITDIAKNALHSRVVGRGDGW